MSYTSVVIADYFMKKDTALKNDIMKILKLVYISHGYYLAFTQKPLIKEDVQAWQYGPVIAELYFRLKTNNVNVYDFQEDYQNFQKDEILKNMLDAIYDKYKKYTGLDLSNLTHKKGTPWDITVNRFASKIDNNIIENHYKTLLTND